MTWPLDLGGGHVLSRVVDNDGTLTGFVDDHPDARNPEQRCGGSVPLDGSRWAQPGRSWQLVSEEPLTLSPSLLCSACGDHGFVREGRWVQA